MNLKKLLSAIGLLAVAAPAALSAVACGEDETSPEQKEADELKGKLENDLKIELKVTDQDNAKDQIGDAITKAITKDKGADSKLDVKYKLPETIEIPTGEESKVIEINLSITKDKDTTTALATAKAKFTLKLTDEAHAEAEQIAKAINEDIQDQKIIFTNKDQANTEIKDAINNKIKDTVEKTDLFIGTEIKDYDEPTAGNPVKPEVTVSIKVAEADKDALATAHPTFSLEVQDQDQADLSEVITTKTVDGNDYNTQEAILNLIVEKDGIDKEAIQVKEFNKATKDADGSAKITPADGNEKYKGEANITITKLSDDQDQADLSEVITTKTVDGNDYNTQEAILNLIVEKDGIDKEAIQVKEFNKATKDADGSAKITPADGNEKYKGEANITITKLSDDQNQADLSEVITTKSVDGNDYNTQEAILNLIVEKDGIDKEAIQFKEFKEATKDADGSAKITPAEGNEKYKGEANITITKLSDDQSQADLSEVITTKSVDGNDYNTQEAILNLIVEKDGIDKEAIQVKEFNKATKDADGSAKITPADGNEKYKGEANITITKLSDEGNSDQEEAEALMETIENTLAAPNKEYSATTDGRMKTLIENDIKKVLSDAKTELTYTVDFPDFKLPGSNQTKKTDVTILIKTKDGKNVLEKTIQVTIKNSI